MAGLGGQGAAGAPILPDGHGLLQVCHLCVPYTGRRAILSLPPALHLIRSLWGDVAFFGGVRRLGGGLAQVVL